MDLINFLQSGFLQKTVLAEMTIVPFLVIIGMGIVALLVYRSLK